MGGESPPKSGSPNLSTGIRRKSISIGIGIIVDANTRGTKLKRWEHKRKRIDRFAKKKNIVLTDHSSSSTAINLCRKKLFWGPVDLVLLETHAGINSWGWGVYRNLG